MTLMIQWLYKAYEKVDAYPKAPPKLMSGIDASGGQRCREGFSVRYVLRFLQLRSFSLLAEDDPGLSDTCTCMQQILANEQHCVLSCCLVSF